MTGKDKVGGKYVIRISTGRFVAVEVVEETERQTYRAGKTGFGSGWVVRELADGAGTYSGTVKTAAKFRRVFDPVKDRHLLKPKPLSQTERVRVATIEAKYSTAAGATEAERQEAQDILTKPTSRIEAAHPLAELADAIKALPAEAFARSTGPTTPCIPGTPIEGEPVFVVVLVSLDRGTQYINQRDGQFDVTSDSSSAYRFRGHSGWKAAVSFANQYARHARPAFVVCESYTTGPC